MLRSRRSIDCANPVARSHPLNQGRVAWWLAVPGLAGGAVWHDLMALPGDFKRGSPGSIPGGSGAPATGPTCGWRIGTQRPGGFGEWQSDRNISQGVNVGPLSALNGTSWSIALWVYLGLTSGSGRMNIFGLKGAANVRNLAYGWDASNKFAIGEENIAFILDSTLIPVIDTWYHLAWTYSAGSNKFYVNGALDNSATYSFSGSYTGNYLFSDTSNVGGLVGTLDDLSVWSRVLGPSEVQALYAESQAGYPATLRRVGSLAVRGSASTRIPWHLFFNRAV